MTRLTSGPWRLSFERLQATFRRWHLGIGWRQLTFGEWRLSFGEWRLTGGRRRLTFARREIALGEKRRTFDKTAGTWRLARMGCDRSEGVDDEGNVGAGRRREAFVCGDGAVSRHAMPTDEGKESR